MDKVRMKELDLPNEELFNRYFEFGLKIIFQRMKPLDITAVITFLIERFNKYSGVSKLKSKSIVFIDGKYVYRVNNKQKFKPAIVQISMMWRTAKPIAEMVEFKNTSNTVLVDVD